MIIPEKLNYKYAIPIASNPVVFGYRHSNDSLENFTVLEGDMADLQSAHVSSTSRIRIVPKEEWNKNGFFVEDYKGQEVLCHKFDITQIKLKKKESNSKALSESSVKTQGDYKSALEKAMKRIEALESKMSSQSENIKISDQQKEIADKKELDDNLSDAGIDTAAMARVVEESKDLKTKEKPNPKPKPRGRPKSKKVGR